VSVWREKYKQPGKDAPLWAQRYIADNSGHRPPLKESGPFENKAFWSRYNRSRLFDYIWIVYSIFFFIEPIERHNTRYWIQFLIVYVAFVAIYSGIIFSRTRRSTYLWMAAMGALGLWYYPRNHSAGGTFIYVAAFIPFVTESLVVIAGVILAMCSALALEGWMLHLSPWSWGLNAFFCLIVGGSNMVASQRMRSGAKLRLAHEEIEQLAKVAERERIARDLHDVLGHTLSVIVLKAELAGRLFSRDPKRAAAEIADVEQISRKALGEVREAIRGYRSEGLQAEIDRAQHVLDAAGVTLTCETKPPSLNPAQESVLALAVREAVTNIVRHAQASRCRLEFRNIDGVTFLSMEDDGRGGVREEGNGLRGMRERVESLGGKFKVESQVGTRLTITIPERA